MDFPIDPDSDAMGKLVDEWLVSLRNEGFSSAQLEQHAAALGCMASRGWFALTTSEQTAMTLFLNWLKIGGWQ